MNGEPRGAALPALEGSAISGGEAAVCGRASPDHSAPRRCGSSERTDRGVCRGGGCGEEIESRRSAVDFPRKTSKALSYREK